MKIISTFSIRSFRTILLLLFTINAYSVISQDDHASDLTQQQFIKGCAQYRSLIIHGITDALVDFHRLCDSLKSVSEYPNAHEKLRKKVIEFMGVSSDNEDQSNFYNLLNGIIEAKHTRIYRKWLETNYDYIYEYGVLLGQGFIERNYPYKLKMNTDLWQEVASYQLTDGMTLVDIGTGGGYFPLILTMSEYEGEFYVTEIDTTLISFLNRKKLGIDFSELESKVHSIEGKQKDASLGEIKADKIFFRETFHHLKHKNEMLLSIRKNIKQDGFVYVKEVVKDYIDNKKENCKKIITKARIISEFQEAGYKLDDDMKLGDCAILRFSLEGHF